MTHLRRYLEEHGVLYPEQLAEATRRQQIYGGSLDTILLELELVDPVTLGELLERACGFPVAPPDLLDNGLDRPWSEIPEDLQRSRWVEPLTRHGDEVVVAVHPDLPDEMLGRLLRSVQRMRPMVVPECCVEKIAAERHGSVVPQRYAILAASYLSAVRRRPSVSGTFATPDLEPPASSTTPTVELPVADVDDTQPMDGSTVSGMIDVVESMPDVPLGPPPQPPARGGTLVPTEHTITRGDTLVSTGAPPAAHGPAARAPAPDGPITEVGPAPQAPVTEIAPPPAPDDPPAVEESTEPSPPPEAPTRARDEADVRRRLEQARAALEATRTRDDALDAVLRAAMVLSGRAGLFRVRGEELVGLSTPRSELEDIGGKIVAAPEGSAAGIALRDGAHAGLSSEPDLRLATGIDATTPFALQRVAVRGRAVVVVYLDRDGEPIEPLDREWLADIAQVGGDTFEEILKLRRRSGPSSAAAPLTAASTERMGDQPEQRWTTPSQRIRVAYGAPIEGDEPAPIEPTSSSRMSTPEREHGEPLPPPPVRSFEPDSAEPADWRLTPDLAARALGDSDSSAAEAAPQTTEHTTEQADASSDANLDSDDGEYHEPRATLQYEDVTVRTRYAAQDSGPAHRSEDRDDEDDETSFANVAAPPEPKSSPEPEAPPPELDAYAEPPATLQVELLPVRPRSEDITEVGLPAAGLEPNEPQPLDAVPIPSDRPTMQLGSLSRRSPEESGPRPAAGPPTESEPSAADSMSRATMHSTPPPPAAPAPPTDGLASEPEPEPTEPEPTEPEPEPTETESSVAPLPPPPPSGVEDMGEDGPRRPRSPTISGLPPPELGPRAAARKRIVPPPPTDALPHGDEDVEIISLARPITPATARGRIELEDEDWMPSGAPLANDEQQHEIDAVLDAVLSGDRDPTDLLAFDNAGMLRVVARFPGPLEILRRDLRSLPPPSAHGPLIRTVIALGADIVPHIIDLLEHPNPDVRFYAAFVFHELRDPRCMQPLGKLAFDGNGDVRIVSMRVLETYRRGEGFDVAASIVREQLGSESRNRQLHAARAAGTLRDIGAVPDLIELLSATDRFIQEASLESLCSITGQQHGLKPHRWRAWYDDNRGLHRVEWIIDSLRHRDLPVRRWAADEL
ncbi:MAG: hypothetical protein AB1Z98_25760, partial [Nannocystaceae bacterium]